MTDEQPYCGTELLPHATAADGSAAPTLCDRETHGRDTWHSNAEQGSRWRWQDAEGNWLDDLGRWIP
jgi:hypothetical protein